jgi:hypothetical protein
MAYLKDIQRLIKKQIPVETDHAWSIKGAEVPLVTGHIPQQQPPSCTEEKSQTTAATQSTASKPRSESKFF